VQTNLRKFLSEASAFQVERNRPVMEHSLGKLVLLLKNVNLKRLDTTSSNDAGSLSSSLTDKWMNFKIGNASHVTVTHNRLTKQFTERNKKARYITE
jgi:hypothetical protein